MTDTVPIERFDVPVTGGTLAAFRIGDVSGDAPTVVAVHGITATSRSWPVVARALRGRATLSCAARGLLDEPSPMQPLEVAQEWAAEDRARRSVVFLPGLNHYTITLAEPGASAVAEQIAAALDGPAARLPRS